MAFLVFMGSARPAITLRFTGALGVIVYWVDVFALEFASRLYSLGQFNYFLSYFGFIAVVI